MKMMLHCSFLVPSLLGCLHSYIWTYCLPALSARDCHSIIGCLEALSTLYQKHYQKATVFFLFFIFLWVMSGALVSASKMHFNSTGFVCGAQNCMVAQPCPLQLCLPQEMQSRNWTYHNKKMCGLKQSTAFIHFTSTWLALCSGACLPCSLSNEDYLTKRMAGLCALFVLLDPILLVYALALHYLHNSLNPPAAAKLWGLKLCTNLWVHFQALSTASQGDIMQKTYIQREMNCKHSGQKATITYPLS